MSAQEYLRMFLNTKIGKLFRLNQNLGQMSCINTQILPEMILITQFQLLTVLNLKTGVLTNGINMNYYMI